MADPQSDTPKPWWRRDLTSAKWIYLKGLLFLAGGALASIAILIETPHWRTGLLLAIAVWCFCRFYYFAFYVIEHYVDPAYRFAGLGSFAAYLLRQRTKDRECGTDRQDDQGDARS